MADKTVLLALKVTGEDAGASKALNSVGTSSSSASSKMAKAGQVAGKVLAVGLAAAGVAAVAATKAAAEDEAAQAKLAVALQKNAGATKDQIAATEEWISVQGKQLGVADDELRPALAKLVGVTGDIGKAQKLASLAMDVSAGSGKSLEQVTKALVSAQNGSVTGLGKFGIAVKKANGDTISLAEAQKRLGDAFGGQAAAQAETAAGKAKILQVQMGELQETIGAKLLPVMLKATDVGLKAIEWMTEHSTATKVLGGVLVGLVTTVYLVGKAITLWSTITKVATGVQAAFNVIMAANPVILVTVAIVALGIAVVVAYKKSETFRKVIDATFSFLKGAVVGTIDFVRNNWKKIIFVLLTGPVGLAVLFFRSKGDAIKDKFSDLVNKVTGFLRNNWKEVLFVLLTGPVGLAVLAVRTKADAIRDKLADMVGAVLGFFRDRWRDLTGLVADTLTAARDKAFELAGSLRDGIADRVTRVIDFFRGLPDRVVTALGDLSGLLVDAGIAVVQGLWDGMIDKWNDVKGWLSDRKDEITDVKGPPSVDKVLLYKAGQYVMDGFLRGLDYRRGKLRAQLKAITSEVRRGIGDATARPIRLETGRFASVPSNGPGPTHIAYIDVKGAVDPMSTARQIRDLLNRESSWNGRLVAS